MAAKRRSRRYPLRPLAPRPYRVYDGEFYVSQIDVDWTSQRDVEMRVLLVSFGPAPIDPLRTPTMVGKCARLVLVEEARRG